MHIHSILQLGESHPVFCEDFLFHEEIGSGLWLGAVMDGCSMGQDSHFASALLGKILKKQVKDLRYKEFSGEIPAFAEYPFEKLGKGLIVEVAKELRNIQQLLYLETTEILSTLILALIDSPQQSAWVGVIGDGVVATHEKIYEIEQDNRPNYLAYHLSEYIDSWYEETVTTFSFSDLNELVIATDGIGSFEQLLAGKAILSQKVEEYVLRAPDFEGEKKPFEKKIAVLKNAYGRVALDDLAIIRFSWKPKD